jgi:hypothetical protein
VGKRGALPTSIPGPRLKRFFQSFLFLILIGTVADTSVSRGQAGSWTTESVLGMMDKSAQDFRTLTADIEHVKYTDVVKAHRIREAGSAYDFAEWGFAVCVYAEDQPRGRV